MMMMATPEIIHDQREISAATTCRQDQEQTANTAARNYLKLSPTT
jgi:hypothetical protein